ncbi:hypothetical protein [Streptomyces sp. NBC_00887]|uniref:hypothetical protein n=1 Tax=Streptomyces sp. NBC_00887 TaxID=2975859 RepID=UPI00386C0969|nr:hypothetical protein OG844_03435 [Streptomyces sp. NBC_00887]WSY35846.1 hypothetical protein OG844_42165 [Streptomyces sp. NBC_00887]
MTGTADTDGSAAEQHGAEAAPPGARLRPAMASVITAVRKAAVVAPPAVIVSYGEAPFVRAATGGTGRLFGAEFWLAALVLAGLRVQGWTRDDSRGVTSFVQGALVVGGVAGPLLLFHGVLAASAMAASMAAPGALAAVLARPFGFGPGDGDT